MFKEKLENLRNKFTERANTLFTSMKDDEEDKDYKIDKKENIKEKIRGLGKTKENDEIEGESSPLVDDRTKKKYDISTEDKKEIRTKVLDNEKESRRADLLYPTMKDKEEKEEKTEKNLDKIDIQKKEKTKEQKERSKLTDSASDKKSKHSLKEVDLNDDDYEILDNTISVKKKKEKFETINNVNFPNDTGNEKIESLKKEAKDSHSARLREDNEFYLKTHPKTNIGKLAVDNIEIPYLKKKAVKETGVEAAENLHMSKSKSYLDTDYAKQHKIYNNYNETPTELREYFKNKISEQIGKDKLDKTKGILIDSNTKSSKDLKDYLISNNEFIGKLKKFDKALKNNYSINNSIQFTGKNWGNAIGRADIRNMHINQNGDIELYITDVYDFNEGEASNLVRVGRNRQDKGEITPYFYAYRVIIPKNEKNEI